MNTRKTSRLMIVLIVLFLLFLVLAVEVGAEEFNTDYMALMQAAAVMGDAETGLAAENARNAKIDTHNLTYQKISWEDLYLLSKIITAEAGSYWLSNEWKMCVGEVVLNRVASPEFPNTVRDVIYQPGQYYGSRSRYFEGLLPEARSVNLARRLLEGERILNEPTVVFQANFTQGSGTHTALYDKILGWTYFCFSNYPDLYKG